MDVLDILNNIDTMTSKYCKENGCIHYAGENKKLCDECIKENIHKFKNKGEITYD